MSCPKTKTGTHRWRKRGDDGKVLNTWRCKVCGQRRKKRSADDGVPPKCIWCHKSLHAFWIRGRTRVWLTVEGDATCSERPWTPDPLMHEVAEEQVGQNVNS